jgi:hypothetical protein
MNTIHIKISIIEGRKETQKIVLHGQDEKVFREAKKHLDEKYIQTSRR